MSMALFEQSAIKLVALHCPFVLLCLHCFRLSSSLGGCRDQDVGASSPFAPGIHIRICSAKLRALADCMREAFGDPPYWEAQG